MLDALSAATLGFLLGLRHATDADHVVAITAIVAREGTFGRAARIGTLWGVGHSLTVLVIGGALILYRVAIPPRLGLGLEFLVALVLIGLGFANLRAQPPGSDATRGHAHDGLRPFTVGVVHGLAGSAAVVLLVLAAIPDPGWAIAYLIVFGLGTVAGMTIVTWLIAAPAVFAAQRVQRFQRGIRLAAGALSIVFGLVLARAIVVDGGLFSATTVWTPR